MTQTAKRLSHTGEYYFSRKLREIDQMTRAGKTVINLGIGSPDMAPHPTVIERLSQVASLLTSHGYQGYKGIPALRAGFADFYRDWYGVALDPESEILPLLGSKEGILHVSMTFVDEGDQVLIPNPGYPTYRSATELAGGTPVEYELDEAGGWLPDLSLLESQDLSRVKLMWVNYPHMPTGAKATMAQLGELVKFADRHGILLCHDNPYSFILNDRPASLLAVPGALGCSVELNSLSKSHNMAGWRVGMLAGSAERVSEILRFKSNMDSGMFLPVQQAAVTALGLGKDWFGSLNEVYKGRRDSVLRLLDQAGCDYNPDQSGLFIWARVPHTFKDGYQFSDTWLSEVGVFVTPGGIFGSRGIGYIRVSLCREKSVMEECIRLTASITQPIT